MFRLIADAIIHGLSLYSWSISDTGTVYKCMTQSLEQMELNFLNRFLKSQGKEEPEGVVAAFSASARLIIVIISFLA